MIPTFDEFLTFSNADIAPVVPQTVVYAPSGTRRSAVLAGRDVDGDDYVRWAHTQMMEAFGLIFSHGVRNIFTVLATPGQFQERGIYRERLIDWICWGVNGPEALRDYARLGCRARLISDGTDPSFDAIATDLHLADTDDRDHVLWYLVVQDREALWSRLLRSVIEAKSATRSDAIHAIYGERIVPASLYLGFGKPMIAPELLPPLLADTVDCYWSQIPGYHLDIPAFRSILYDHLYLRRTWTPDKAARAQQIEATGHDWDSAPILGLGRRCGPFWYPVWSNSVDVTKDCNGIP